MWQTFAGTVLLAGVLAAAVLWAVMRGVKALEPRDEITQPEDVVERLGALTAGQVFTDTAQKRADAKRRLHLVATKERGRAKLATFTPKGAA